MVFRFFLRILGLANAWCRKLEEEEMKEEEKEKEEEEEEEEEDEEEDEEDKEEEGGGVCRRFRQRRLFQPKLKLNQDKAQDNPQNTPAGVRISWHIVIHNNTRQYMTIFHDT